MYLHDNKEIIRVRLKSGIPETEKNRTSTEQGPERPLQHGRNLKPQFDINRDF